MTIYIFRIDSLWMHFESRKKKKWIKSDNVSLSIRLTKFEDENLSMNYYTRSDSSSDYLSGRDCSSSFTKLNLNKVRRFKDQPVFSRKISR